MEDLQESEKRNDQFLNNLFEKVENLNFSKVDVDKYENESLLVKNRLY